MRRFFAAAALLALVAVPARIAAQETPASEVPTYSESAGAEYVDLEPDAAAALPRTGSTMRIVSMHDFQGLPDGLAAAHARLAACDADVVKLAVMALLATMLVRYPDGIRGKSFYQWNVPAGVPPWHAP